MKRIITCVSILAAVLSVSCSKTEIRYDKSMGMLSMDVKTQQTKADSDEDLYSSAVVNIYKSDFSGLVRTYKYTEMPSPFYLKADAYRVDVVAGEAALGNPALASWDKKSYKGSQEFTIIAGEVTTVEVEAGVSNAVTNITFDPTVAENFSEGYTATVSLGDGAAQLVYDASKSGAEGYFIISGIDEPSFTWTFTGTLTKDDSDFTKTGTIEGIQPGKMYKLNLRYTIKDGDIEFTLMVDKTTENIDDVIIFEPVSTGLASTPSYEIWATRTTFYADVDAAEYADAAVCFTYSSDGVNWDTITAESVMEGSWKADVSGLTPSTDYEYKLLVNDEVIGDSKYFTTDKAPAIYNGSFEHVSLVKDQTFYKFYDPDCGVEGCTTKFWASGNGDEENSGSAGMGYVITDIDKDVKYHGNQSVRAQSLYAVVKLAAGNLFTGYFAGLDGTKGGKVNFGRPWTGRPTALKLYCKYTTGVMNYVDGMPDGVTLKKDETLDRAQIKCAIGTWDYKTYGGTKECPVQVNTTDESTFIDFYTDTKTIANGDVIIYKDGYDINRKGKQSIDTNQWLEYVIPLEYRDITTFPTHIIISCASSQYGDYFSGSTDSKLWLDAVELVY